MSTGDTLGIPGTPKTPRIKSVVFFNKAKMNDSDILLKLRVTLSDVVDKGIPADSIDQSAELCQELISSRGISAVVQDMNGMLQPHLRSLALALESYTEGSIFLSAMQRVWSRYFCDILSWIQAIFMPLHIALSERDPENSIMNVCLGSFRDVVLLNDTVKRNLEMALAETNYDEAAPQLRQMIAIMMSDGLRTKDQKEMALKEIFRPYIHVLRENTALL